MKQLPEKGANIIIKPVNICVVGDPKSGKSSLINCFLYKTFEEKSIDTILNVTRVKMSFQKNQQFHVMFYDVSGYLDRDSEVISDYIKNADIFFICHSFENDFNEENIKSWLEFLEHKSERLRNIYVIGCKLDLKAMIEFAKDEKKTILKYQRTEQLSAFGQRIKTFINNAGYDIKEYYMVSSLLNYNVNEVFNSAIKDFIFDNYIKNNSQVQINKKDNNCILC